MSSLPKTAAPLILAIDIGTSSSRSALYTAQGERLLATTAQRSYPLQTDAEGRAELSAAVLEQAVKTVITETLRLHRPHRSKNPITAIGVSCFWHSLLGLDAKGRPVTPIYTWADSRCRADAEKLRQSTSEKILHARTGCMTRASFWPAKLLWLRRTNPALFRKVDRWVSPAEWIQERWCGFKSASVSLSMASGTGLLADHAWDKLLLRRCKLTLARLNPLSDEPHSVSASTAKRFPELNSAKWFPAIGDGAASNLGSGALIPGIAAINVGTSAALRVVTTGPMKPTALGLFRYRIDGERRLIGGAVSNAGNLRAWALKQLRLPDSHDAIEEALHARPGPVEELTVLPFWTAERAPTWPEGLPSAVIGMTAATTAIDLLQTLLESTYHRLAQIAALVEQGTVERKLTFLVSGGIQHSTDSLQRLANALNRTLYASAEPEASLRGAAVFVLQQLGFNPPSPGRGPAIRPQPSLARAYAAAGARQKQLEEFVRTWKTTRRA